MLTKLTAKNQITLPADVLRAVPASEYFDATVEGDRIVLRPVRITPVVDLDRVRAHVAAAGATEADIDDAVAWARRR